MKCDFGILIDDFGSLTILQQQELTILIILLINLFIYLINKLN